MIKINNSIKYIGLLTSKLLVVCLVCTKVVGATSGEGFLAYYILSPFMYRPKLSLNMLQTILISKYKPSDLIYALNSTNLLQ